MEKLKAQLEKLEQQIAAGEFIPMTTNGRQKPPNRVRTAIRKYCEENDVTMPKFRQLINVNSASFNKFMSGKYQNPWSATSNSTYLAASSFLALEAVRAKIAKKEGNGSPGDVNAKTKGASDKPGALASSKEARTELVATINAVELEDEAVFDDCNVVRSKINAFIKKHGFTMSAFGKCIGVNTGSISRFLSQKGEGGGAANGCYTAAYRFFEKQRILEKKPKSSARLAAEKDQGPSGFSLSHSYSGRWQIKDTASTKRSKSTWTMDAENTRPNKMGRYPNPRAGF